MPDKIQGPKGANDVLPGESPRWQAVERAARDVATRYNFAEIRTPVFEHTELFHRGMGETTDVVTKETYTFEDRGGRSITLRPEGTAGVVRSVIEHNLAADAGSVVKVYYIGPNFRFERPQSGRLRIHHQFGVEAFGVPNPEMDVECIALQFDFYRAVGLKDVSLDVNSLGDAETKARYRDALRDFLLPKRDGLSEDSQRRLETNPLRILDSKDPRDREACLGCPTPQDVLSGRSREHFDAVQRLLNDAGVPFVVNPKLVRGLDYYTETLWEFVAAGLGAQSAVGGGGRYDTLVESLGGKPTPGVGFGSGLERLLLALEAQKVEPTLERPRLVWLAAQNDAARPVCMRLMRQLRNAGLAADMDLTGRGMKAQFKLADRNGATHCIVIGDEELAANEVTLKNLATGEQRRVHRNEVVSTLQS